MECTWNTTGMSGEEHGFMKRWVSLLVESVPDSSLFFFFLFFFVDFISASCSSRVSLWFFVLTIVSHPRRSCPSRWTLLHCDLLVLFLFLHTYLPTRTFFPSTRALSLSSLSSRGSLPWKVRRERVGCSACNFFSSFFFFFFPFWVVVLSPSFGLARHSSSCDSLSYVMYSSRKRYLFSHLHFDDRKKWRERLSSGE